MSCSEHFNKRCKERLGLNKRATNSFLEKAVKYGLRMKDIKHKRSLYCYMIAISEYSDPQNELIIYNHWVLVVTHREGDNIGITVLNLPKEYHSTVDAIKNKKGDDKDDKRKRKKRNATSGESEFKDYSHRG